MTSKRDVLTLSRHTVDSTVGGKTLEQLGVTFDPNANMFSIQNAGSTAIYVNRSEAADANSFILLASGGGFTLNVTANMAKALRFYCATTGTLNVLQSWEE